MHLSERVKELSEEVSKVRRDLHKIPEIGFCEYKTSEYICSYLDDISVKYEKNIAMTGVIAYINAPDNNDEALATIAFRADMDALSLKENCNVDYKSGHDGFMHGCGHDGHMTMLLLFAKLLNDNKSCLKSNVVLIFQPAEEGPGGAKKIIQEGIFDKYKIDEIYGIHLHPEFDQGVLAINSGPVMAMTGEFDIDIYSKSGHGAMPHTAIDGIVIASSFISQLQTIISRNINPTDAGVVTIGRIEGGERRNIIADHVRLEGTTRAFSEDVFGLIKKRMYKLVESFEVAYSCKIVLDYREMYPPVVNDEKCVEEFKLANKSLSLVKFPPQMIAEDFSYYLKEVPGAFVFLGTKNEKKKFIYPLHNSKFNFDESALLFGIQSYINILNFKGSNL